MQSDFNSLSVSSYLESDFDSVFSLHEQGTDSNLERAAALRTDKVAKDSDSSEHPSLGYDVTQLEKSLPRESIAVMYTVTHFCVDAFGSRMAGAKSAENIAPPKKFYRTFWRSITKRIIAREHSCAGENMEV